MKRSIEGISFVKILYVPVIVFSFILTEVRCNQFTSQRQVHFTNTSDIVPLVSHGSRSSSHSLADSLRYGEQKSSNSSSSFLHKRDPERNPSKSSNSVSRAFRLMIKWVKNRIPSWLKSGPRVSNTQSSTSLDSRSLYQSSPFQTASIAGVHVEYKIPDNRHDIVGVALLFHGCQQNATDWSQLPEHRQIVFHLLKQRLGIIAFTSRDRVTGCWSTRFPSEHNLDASAVIKSLHLWLSAVSIPADIPMYAIGISSGASFLTVLAQSVQLPHLHSQALYMSAGNQRALRDATGQFPNTLFVYLLSDNHYASVEMVTTSKHILSQRNVQNLGELPLDAVTFEPDTFHKREPRISLEHSHQLYDVSKNYRGKAMEFAIRTSTNAASERIRESVQLQRAVRQITRIVSGAHEVSGTHADLVTKWLIQNGVKSRS